MPTHDRLGVRIDQINQILLPDNLLCKGQRGLELLEHGRDGANGNLRLVQGAMIATAKAIRNITTLLHRSSGQLSLLYVGSGGAHLWFLRHNLRILIL